MEKTSTWKKITRSKTFALFLVLVLIIVIFFVMNKAFLGIKNIRNIMNAASISGIILIGMGMLLISGNVDLSAGATGTLAGVLMALMIQQGMPWPVALIIALVFGAAAGTINAFLWYVCKIFPFIATLAMSSVWQGTCCLITGLQNVTITDKSLTNLATSQPLGMPIGFVIMVVLMLIYGIILARTKFGRTIYMVGGNFQAARLAGISLPKVGTILMINCSVIASLAGCLFAARMKFAASPTGGIIGKDMDAITAAVLGGIAFTGGAGSMLGGFIGIMLLTAFQNGLVVIGMSSYWQVVAGGLLLIVALAFDYISTRSAAKKLKKKVA